MHGEGGIEWRRGQCAGAAQSVLREVRVEDVAQADGRRREVSHHERCICAMFEGLGYVHGL